MNCEDLISVKKKDQSLLANLIGVKYLTFF